MYANKVKVVLAEKVSLSQFGQGSVTILKILTLCREYRRNYVIPVSHLFSTMLDACVT